MLEKRVERGFSILFFLSFLAQALFCALRIQESIFPDEPHHLRLAQLFSAPGVWRLHDSPETWPYGPVSRYPYLYHLVMGKLLALCPSVWDQVLYLRLWNIAISALAMGIVFWGIEQHLRTAEERLTARAVVCHIPMLSFLAGAVTYDNAIYGLSALATLFLIETLLTGSRKKLLLSFIVLMVASLIKFVVLPFYLIFGLFLIAQMLRSTSFRKALFSSRLPREGWLLGLFALLFTLNVELYGTNIAVYHQIMPSADKVLGYDNAAQHYAQFQRDESFAKTIDQRPLVPLKSYLKNYAKQASKGIFSIFAHRSVDRAQYQYNRYIRLIALLFWGVVTVLLQRFRRIPPEIAYCAITAVAYVGVVIAENYASYKADHVFGAGLQGRYLFPIVLPVVLAATWLVFNGVKRRELRWAVLVLVAFVFIQNSLIFMLPHMETAFFR